MHVLNWKHYKFIQDMQSQLHMTSTHVLILHICNSTI